MIFEIRNIKNLLSDFMMCCYRLFDIFIRDKDDIKMKKWKSSRSLEETRHFCNFIVQIKGSYEVSRLFDTHLHQNFKFHDETLHHIIIVPLISFTPLEL